MVTVAVRRVNLTDKSKESLLDYIDREKIFILPNTAACYNRRRSHSHGAAWPRSRPLELGQAGSNRRPANTFSRHGAAYPSHARPRQRRLRGPPYTNDDLIAARK